MCTCSKLQGAESAVIPSGLVNMNARMVYVGKQSGYHTRTQEEIHQLLEVRPFFDTSTPATSP